MISAKSGVTSVMSLLLVAVLASGAGLLALGFLHARDQRRIADLEGRLASALKQRDSVAAADVRETGTGAGLNQQGLAKLRRRVEALNRDGKSSPDSASSGNKTPGDPAARLLALRARMPALMEAKDGAGLLALMGEMAALGEVGYASAIELAYQIRGNFEAWGLDAEEFVTGFPGPALEMCSWALRNPDKSENYFRSLSVLVLGYSEGVDHTAVLIEALKIEQDPIVLSDLADWLERNDCNGFDAEIGAAARQHASDPDIAIPLLWALVSSRTSEADRILEEFSHAEEADVRRMAEITILARNPPVAGFIVRYVKAADDSGLQPGDIITALDGRPVSEGDDLDSTLSAAPPEQIVAMTVDRGGQTMTLSVKGGERTIRGVDVRPRK